MADLPDALKNLRTVIPTLSELRDYKTSAPERQVLETLGRMKLSFMADGMCEPDADRRVLMMLDAYGIARDVFNAFFEENRESL